jgi:L-ascorbate metabolism protein UlaG (beta-lactamase superfamily)
MEIPRLLYVGHATVLIELDGMRLLTDPVLRKRVMHLRRHTAVEIGGLADVDAVLVSHLHYDHFDPSSLRLLGRDVTLVVPRGAGRLLRRFHDVREVRIGDELQLGAVRIRATHAEHPGGIRPTVWSAPALGFLVSGSRTVYFAGDTDLFAGMSGLAPSLDVALLPVAGWGPRVGPGHLDPQRAVEALRLLRPRLAVPIHWGTLSTPRQRPSTEPPESFRRLATERAPDVEVRVLAPGAATNF